MTLQDGWTLASDGLHIHRWYLHVEPYRYDRLAAMHRAHPQREHIDEVLGSHTWQAAGHAVGVAVLEHLLHRPWSDGSDVVLRGGITTAGRQTPTPPAPVVRAGDCTPSGRSYVAPAGALTDRRGFPAAVDDALAVAQLGYLVRLGAGVVVHVNEPATPGGHIRDDEPLCTVLVQPDDDPLRYAAALAVAGGAEMLRLFIETGHMYVNAPEGQPRDTRPPRRFVELAGAGQADAAPLAVEVFAAAVRHRYWARLAAAGHGGAATARQARLAEAAVHQHDDVVYPIGEAFGCIDTFDLINAFFPGPRQFAKNRIGIGPGQGH